MTDQLVSFETAKLAREKGFPFDGSSTYKHVNILQDSLFGTPLTTQSLLQKWLRENYNIHVHICVPYGHKWIMQLHDVTGNLINVDSYHDTYEQALEIGLQEALNLLSCTQ